MEERSQENFPDMANLVRRKLEEFRWTQTELSNRSGVPGSVISRFLRGTKTIGIDSIYRILTAVGVLDELAPARIPDSSSQPIPIISWVRAGKFAEVSDAYPPGISGEGEPVFSKKAVSPRAFALRVERESMLPRFMPGDLIIVDPELGCENGDFCVVKCNDEVTFKRLQYEEDCIILRALNSRFPDIVIRRESEVDFQVIGRVVDMIPAL